MLQFMYNGMIKWNNLKQYKHATTYPNSITELLCLSASARAYAPLTQILLSSKLLHKIPTIWDEINARQRIQQWMSEMKWWIRWNFNKIGTWHMVLCYLEGNINMIHRFTDSMRVKVWSTLIISAREFAASSSICLLPRL